MPEVPIGLSNQPYYVRNRDNKDWAIEQERYRHDQALYTIGENVMFALLWRIEDFTHGYVRRCPRCYSATDKEISEVYNQPTINKCPMCYGTSFEGGIRAKIIRPAVVSDTDDDESQANRGATYVQRVAVESTSDFRFRSGDFMFRADGSRWQLSAPSRVTIRTGFAHPSQQADSMGYTTGSASLENESSVAWIIPPSKDDLAGILYPAPNYPVSQVDRINGPLIPDGWTD